MLENPTLEDFINIEKKKIDIKYTTKNKVVPINSNIVNALIAVSGKTKANISREMGKSSGWLANILCGKSLIKMKDLQILAEKLNQPSVDLLFLRKFDHSSEHDMKYLERASRTRAEIQKNVYEKRHAQKSKTKNLETEKFANTAIDHTAINQISLDSFRNDFAKMYIAFTNLTKSIDKFTAQLQLNDERRQKEHEELIKRIDKQQTYLVGEIKKANSSKITSFDRNRGAL